MDLVERILLHSAFSPYLFPLLLLVIANTVAWLAALIFGTELSAPLDFGITLRDGSRLLGDHKTWRGLVSAAVACAAVTQSFHLGLLRGAAFGTLALLGDAAASFIKRRLQFAPGTEVVGLDQLPEALVPLLILQRPLGLGLADCLLIAAIFAVLDIAVTKLRHLR
jgi:CDP-diglyceride synthetase